MEGAVDRGVRQPGYIRRRNRQKAAAAAILVLSLTSALVAGCGGGSSGNPGGGGPPPPTFTTIDAPGAGTTSPQGTFGTGVTANDNVIGYFIDSGGVVHGFVRTSLGNFAIIDENNGFSDVGIRFKPLKIPNKRKLYLCVSLAPLAI